MIFLSKYITSLKIDKIHDFNSWNVNFPHGWYFKMRSSFFINTLLFNRKSTKFTTSCRNIFSLLILLSKVRFFFSFFFINKLLFYWKSVKFSFFVTSCQNIKFPHGYFLNALFFWINTLLIFQKSAKFAINCRNLNFPSSRYFFFNVHFFAPIRMLLFRRKSAKFATNCRNLSFPRTIFLNERFLSFSFHKDAIFYWRNFRLIAKTWIFPVTDIF